MKQSICYLNGNIKIIKRIRSSEVPVLICHEYEKKINKLTNFFSTWTPINGFFIFFLFSEG